MTHRPIRPIDVNGFEPGGTPRALPIFEWVDPASLLVDEAYQRDPSERTLKLVRKIVSGWDWARFKPPVAVLTDAGLELIDGQHTAISAATHPDVDKIPVMIVEATKLADRAGAFISHNRDRVAVTATALHHAALTAGDAEAQAVQRVCVEAGVTVLRAPPGNGKFKAAQTIAVSAVAHIIRTRGEVPTVRVMSSLARAGLAPITQVHIRAADLLLNDDEYKLSPDALISTIQAMALKVDQEAAVFRAAHPSTPVWKAVGITWFKNRRGAKNGLSLSGKPSGNLSDCRDSTGSELPYKAAKSAENREKTAVIPPGPNSHPEFAGLRKPANSPKPVGDSGVLFEVKRDDRAELGGWQPGRHIRRCGSCGESFVGGRKAEQCADCAYRAEEVARAS